MTTQIIEFPTRLFNLWQWMARRAGFLALALVVATLLFARLALAQTVDVPPVVDDPLKLAASFLNALVHGQGWPAAAAIVSLLTWAFRSGILLKLPTEGALAPLGKVSTWLATHPVVSFLTPFVRSGVLGYITTVVGGAAFSWPVFVSEVLKIGAGAVAAYIGTQKVLEAKNAGKLESAGITTQQEALDELKKRVIKGAPPAPVA